MANRKKEEPGYYAVIPANVRYDKTLSPYARLLYGEISSLCNKKGFCWASNAYFADLYRTSERSVINWINSLKDAGYIALSFKYKPGTKLVDKRLIRLVLPPEGVPPKPAPATPESSKGGENIFTAPGKDFRPEAMKQASVIGEKGLKQASENPEPSENCKKSSKPALATPESSKGGENIFTAPGKDFHHVVKQVSEGGETGFTDNIKSNSKAAAANNIPVQKNEEPPEKTAAASQNKNRAEEIQTLKRRFECLKPLLALDNAFYPEALNYLSSANLDFNFVSWMHEFCVKKKPASLSGYFFKVFFHERYAQIYKESFKPPPPPEIITVFCAACGTVHSANCPECPLCGLPRAASAKTVSLHKKLRSFPEDKRAEYFRRENEIIAGYCFHNREKGKRLLAGLKKEFGLPDEE